MHACLQEEMPLFEDSKGFLSKTADDAARDVTFPSGRRQPFAAPTASAPAIYDSKTGASLVGIAGAAAETCSSTRVKKGRPALVYHSPVRTCCCTRCS